MLRRSCHRLLGSIGSVLRKQCPKTSEIPILKSSNNQNELAFLSLQNPIYLRGFKRPFSSKAIGKLKKLSISCQRVFCQLKNSYFHFSGFESASDETLESLCEHLEELLESDPNMADADVTLASGVLTVKLPQPHGTFVINKQTPNQQIWLSSPQSGPARFDLKDSKRWIYKHTNESLHALLNKEIGTNILGLENPGFETCYLGGNNDDSSH